ncbi:MAG TPA: M50 family metallopeptidase [Acidimicrobiales bacterium]|nr:M50 family metallopeptidase [Acidimicrobiales bacterium]
MTSTQHTPPEAPEAPAQDHGGWRDLAPVAAVLVLAVLVSLATDSFPIVAFILAVVAMVMVHEAGHFLTAKWAGMKVTEFFFGFGPRLWSTRRGETEYGVKAIPLGGYVKIIGMSNLERDIDPADEPRTYRRQSYGRRVLVASAGIATHFVIAVVVLTVLWSVLGVPRYDRPTTTVGEISRLRTGESPAQRAGFEVGDRIISYDGRPARDWMELPPYIRERAGQPITFVVDRRGERITIEATPAEVTREGRTAGFIGLSAKPVVERVSPIVGLGRAVRDTGDLTWRSVQALGSFFAPGSLRNYADQVTGGSPATKDAVDASRPVSIVGVVRIAGQAAESGLFNVLQLFVLLNLFVGIFNLIPLLPLDGGHVAIATYERIRSRGGRRYQADVGKMLPFTAAVVALLLVLGLTSIWLDIVRPVANPFQ